MVWWNATLTDMSAEKYVEITGLGKATDLAMSLDLRHTARKEMLPVVHPRADFSGPSGHVSCVARPGITRGIVQRETARQQVDTMGGVHWSRLIQ